MNSSVALFSNQGDPFPTQGQKRSHYHPSQPQPLSEGQKQTVLSPDRLRFLPHHLYEALSPTDLRFLEGSQRLVPAVPESDSSGPFDESWPSSEGSSKTPERDERSIGVGTGTSQIPRGSQSSHPATEDSVIAKYIARFRNGHPTSRLERSPPQSTGKDFWWLQVSPDSPDAQRHRPGSGILAVSGFSPQSLERSPLLGEGSLSDSRLCFEDVDLVSLQERAGKLVLRSESSLSSVDPVSSEGLGSSPSSGGSVSECGRSRTRQCTLDAAPVVPVQRPLVTLPIPSIQTHPTLAPEEDILYQWRLRRKMEQAREGSLPLTTRRRAPSPPVRIPKQVFHTVDPSESPCHVQPQEAALSSHVPVQRQNPTCYIGSVPLASPSLALHPTSSIVPPHLHLLCDILPCARSPHSAPCPPGREEASHPPAAASPLDGAQHVAELHKSQPEKALQKPEQPVERKSKSRRRTKDRTGSGERIPERIMEAPVPESPIHQAVEQVISERLFSPLPSPKPKFHTRKPRPVTPPTEEDEELQPVEIAAHLLEEAEDSDGTEFADDPLLQVLREQRESLRSRLRVVDLRLAEMEGKGSGHRAPPH
ncbi:proline and serine-rich protein 3 isoform X2 [Pseudophryne corroboree]|uniref:proline and serine-rich protein 3 isoform X2 n=1 Tax=Pseudophryne corroboree TaxID=495146 RepID=UPI003081696B